MSYRDSNLESSAYNSNSSVFSVSLTPGVSYFIIDKLAIGLNATLTYDGIKNNKSYCRLNPLGMYTWDFTFEYKTLLSIIPTLTYTLKFK